MTKPNVFIGSSRETMDVANAIHSQINYDAQVTPWFAGAFTANSYTMEALEKQLDGNDFGIFVFAPDDVVLYRGRYVFITRDNTLFEMGLFWGRLRRKRVFAVIPRDIEPRDDLVKGENVKEFHILSDLHGLTLLHYEGRTDDNLDAAVSVACRAIKKAIQAEGQYNDPINQLIDMEEEIHRKRRILHFFLIYNKVISENDDKKRYEALSDALRTSIMPPPSFLVTGAAIWKTQGNDGIGQVGGDVGEGRFFTFNENQLRAESGQQPIYVLDAYLTSKWCFFDRTEVEQVYILCYPLRKDHVLSVHFSGNQLLDNDQLEMIVKNNTELLRVINQLISGRDTV